MIYMLDTNIIIYYLKGQFPHISHHLRHTAPGDIKIPSVVIAELEYGAHLCKDYNSEMTKVRSFLAPFDVSDFNESCARHYGQIRSSLQKSGNLIGANDMLIAATALSYNATLITHNIDEFSRIDSLSISDWTQMTDG